MGDFQAYNQALAGGAQMEAGEQLAHAMKLIIIPMLTRSFELDQHKVLDDACVRSMVKDMFDPAEEIQGMHKTCINLAGVNVLKTSCPVEPSGCN